MRMKRWLFLIFFTIFSLIVVGSVQAQSDADEMLEGRIVEITNQEITNEFGESFQGQEFKIKVKRGSLAGEDIVFLSDPYHGVDTSAYGVGDEVAVLRTVSPDGTEQFFITDFVRRSGLWILFCSFVFLAVVIGGRWGASSVVGMAFSFAVIVKLVLPMIMAGQNAIMAAVLGSILIIPVTFGLSHGWKVKTWIAGLGTVITLILTGLMAVLAVEMTKLAGFGSEEALFLQAMVGGEINMKGLLLAGVIISSLGILDDITISQASVVAELKSANSKLGFGELFQRAMNVGRDHIASLINTLVLVYAGASLPLLLLFMTNDAQFLDVINTELVAEEIVRTLVGSSGLILAVPITTFLAAGYFHRQITATG